MPEEQQDRLTPEEFQRSMRKLAKEMNEQFQAMGESIRKAFMDEAIRKAFAVDYMDLMAKPKPQRRPGRPSVRQFDIIRGTNDPVFALVLSLHDGDQPGELMFFERDLDDTSIFHGKVTFLQGDHQFRNFEEQHWTMSTWDRFQVVLGDDAPTIYYPAENDVARTLHNAEDTKVVMPIHTFLQESKLDPVDIYFERREVRDSFVAKGAHADGHTYLANHLMQDGIPLVDVTRYLNKETGRLELPVFEPIPDRTPEDHR